MPDARSAGVELELAAQPATFFDFAVSASVADARLQSTITSTDADGAVGVVSGIEAGRRLPTTRRFQGAAAATWRWLASGGWVAYLSGTFQHVGSRYTPSPSVRNPRVSVHRRTLTSATSPATKRGLGDHGVKVVHASSEPRHGLFRTAGTEATRDMG